jgi:TonB family protein
LTLGQRRVLSLLQTPAAVEELAQKHHLEPEKLARDLKRLAELNLISLPVQTKLPEPAPSPVPATFAPVSPAPVRESMAPVVIGRSTRRLPMVPLAAGAAALALAVGIWWGTRAKEMPSPSSGPAIATPAPAATPSSPPPSIARSTIDEPSAVATLPRGKSLPADFRGEISPQVRPGLQTAAVSANQPAALPKASETKTISAPESLPRDLPAPAPAAVEPVAAGTPAPVVEPAISAVLSPEPTIPVKVAVAAPAAIAPRPAPVAALKAISREAPDFPKEAIADGLKSGIVNARIHVDATGNVTGVDILASQPPRVFDRATRKALLRWQFEPNAAGHTADLDVDVKFQRD